MSASMVRTAYVVKFIAVKEEVVQLRHDVRRQLEGWGLRRLVDDAQLCVGELVANVVTHVGAGTPTTLSLLLRGPFLRIEVADPDPRTLPTLVSADVEAEGGRGMALVAAVTDRWGVSLLGDGKVTWCEIVASPGPGGSSPGGLRAARAETMIDLYSGAALSSRSDRGRLRVAEAEEAAILIITDLLHWLRAHGRDADDALDRAQMRFENQESVRS
ncbi:ATP-binding protein [Streptomyces parvulus]|uniref:ATP-binding protein n=1 Tax=Streptomyces parvulus TaxID=146923 RepID=UPI00210C1272|nr:ATP-binding protein [Streptomyces parvulus]MCQ4196175.1 ATP-binding protein [Streptomyces parvulus]